MYEDLITKFDQLPDEYKATILGSITPDLVRSLYILHPDIPYIKELIYQVNHNKFETPSLDSYNEWVEQYQLKTEAISKYGN